MDKDKLFLLLKILTAIGFMVGFSFLVLKITKTFASTCPDGSMYDDIQKKCRKICPDDKPNYDPISDSCNDCPQGQIKRSNQKCGFACRTDEDECGDSCYNMNSQQCINNFPCNNNQIYHVGGATGPLGCCSIGKVADIGNDGIATGCTDIICKKDEQLCGNYCCDKEKSCCNGKCCEKGQKCMDGKCCNESDIHGDKCCKNYSEKQGKCCPDEDIIVKDGDCYVKCGDQITTCKWEPNSDKICEDIYIYNKDGIKTNKKSICVTRPLCRDLGQVQINPQDLIDSNGNHITTCSMNSDKTYPLATCNISDISSYNRNFYIPSITTSSTCNEDDCFQTLSRYEGIMNVSENQNTDGSFNSCEGKFSCAALLKDIDCKKGCPIKDSRGNTSNQCCIDENNNYTGLVCEEGKGCYKDNNGEYKCSNHYWSGIDTNYQCKISDKLDPKHNKEYKADSIEASKLLCEEDKSVYRCNIDPFILGEDGNCFYYNPAKRNNYVCSSTKDNWNEQGVFSWVSSQNLNDPSANNYNPVITRYQPCCDHRGADYHSFLNEQTTNIPYGMHYCNNDGKVTSDAGCDGLPAYSSGNYIKCTDPNGCSLGNNSFTCGDPFQDGNSYHHCGQNWYMGTQPGYENDQPGYCSKPNSKPK